MMESYEGARIDTKSALEVEEILGLKIQNNMDVLNCGQLNENKPNVDFGAEIVTAEILDGEEEIKTNFTKITHAEEEALRELSTTTEMVLNDLLSDLEEQVHHNYQSQQDDDGNGDDDEDDDNYQSDENENTDDNHRQIQNSDANREAESLEETSTDSDFSDLSGLSDISGREWKPIQAHPLNWVQKQINQGADPRALLSQMLPAGARHIAPGLNDMTLWRILVSMLSEPPRRQKLRYVNTFEDVLRLIQQSQNIMVLTGAGVSVSCGIPDFRSSDGIYARLAKDYPDLPDPQAMFDINYFSRDPRPFFKFAREIYPGQFKPSPCHRFIKLLEEKNKLLRNYTQNIDTLEQVAGIHNVIECHGSFSTASCTKCKFKCNADAIRADIFAQRIPVCPRCQPNVQQSADASERVSEAELKQLVQNGIMKPDIVFFGEGLPELFHTVMASDKDKCDLLIVIGSSLKVRPVALIPSSIPSNVPQILINREQLHHLEFDVELLGDSDVIINQLCHHLGNDWTNICFDDAVLKESRELIPLEECSTVGDDYAPQLQDADTQSVQSNASTDIALRSAGASSDSGFESSTCSAVTKTDLVDGQMESVDFGNQDFHPFVERLGNETTTSYSLKSRHMSIDSSKDSGIQFDSSHSAMTIALNGGSGVIGGGGSQIVPIENFNDGGDGIVANDGVASTSAAQAYTKSMQDSDIKMMGNKIVISSGDCNLKQRRRQKRISVADRLVEGTYYRHNSCSYVFPGALVSWCTDSEEEDETEEENDDSEEVEDKLNLEDLDTAPLSPLLPPSVEAEMVNEMTTSMNSTTSSPYMHSIKRTASDNYYTVTSCTVSQLLGTDNEDVATTIASTSACNQIGTNDGTLPPTKRRRHSGEESPTHIDNDYTVPTTLTSPTTANTKTIPNSTDLTNPKDCTETNISSNSSDTGSSDHLEFTSIIATSTEVTLQEH